MPAWNATALDAAYTITTLPASHNVSADFPHPTYIVSVGALLPWVERAHQLLSSYALCLTACYRVDRARGYNASAALALVQVPLHRTWKVGTWVHRGLRDVEPTLAHLRAWEHMASVHASSTLGLFVEEDFEFWVAQATLSRALLACAAAASLTACHLGGCWGLQAADCNYSNANAPSAANPFCHDKRVSQSIATLADGSQLLQLGKWPIKTGRARTT